MYATRAAHQKHAEQPVRDAGRAGLASGATGRSPAGPARGRRRAWCLLALAAGSALGALACSEEGAGPAEAVGEGEYGIEGGRIASDATEVVRVDYVSETPGMVSMGVSCSGVIIAPNLVLTARHCVSPRSIDGACDGQGSFGPVSDAPMVVRVQTPTGALVEVPVDPGSRVVADTSEKSCGPDLALLFVPKLATYRNEPWFWVASPR
ncbi:MAG TPA: trypsin-like serine protease, partial [Polyangiaceae bacterium]|nr:trypsin-like serine protease [Polyangiaceae bacterium]